MHAWCLQATKRSSAVLDHDPEGGQPQYRKPGHLLHGVAAALQPPLRTLCGAGTLSTPPPAYREPVLPLRKACHTFSVNALLPWPASQSQSIEYQSTQSETCETVCLDVWLLL